MKQAVHKIGDIYHPVEGVTKALKKKRRQVNACGIRHVQEGKRKARKGRNPQTGEAI